MGHDLFLNEPVFHDTILACNKIIKKINNTDILPFFQNPKDNTFFDKEPNLWVSLVAKQISLATLWQSKSIVPEAVMGMSLGEIAGVYCSGGLSLEEAFVVCKAFLTISERIAKVYLFSRLNCAPSKVQALCIECPVWVNPAELGEFYTSVCYHENDYETVMAFFNSKEIECFSTLKRPWWPYHTEAVKGHKHLIEEITRNIVPKPLKNDYYSSALGKLIKKNTKLPLDYWYNVALLPTNWYDAMPVKNEKTNWVIITIGPRAYAETELTKYIVNLKTNAFVFETTSAKITEIKQFKYHNRPLNRLNLNKTPDKI